VRIIAGSAGSGKTKEVVNRARQIEEKGGNNLIISGELAPTYYSEQLGQRSLVFYTKSQDIETISLKIREFVGDGGDIDNVIMDVPGITDRESIRALHDLEEELEIPFAITVQTVRTGDAPSLFFMNSEHYLNLYAEGGMNRE
jgi:thymidine kinase